MGDLKMVDVAMLPPCSGHVHGENDEQMDGMGYQFNGLRGFFSQMTQLEAPKKRNAHQTAAKNHLHCSKCKTKVSSEGLAPVLWLRSLGKKASKTSGLLKGWIPKFCWETKWGEPKHDGEKIIETHSLDFCSVG